MLKQYRFPQVLVQQQGLPHLSFTPFQCLRCGRRPQLVRAQVGDRVISGASKTTAKALRIAVPVRSLVALSVHFVKLRAYVDEFLNSDGILAEFEIDHARTAEIGTGEVIYFDKPSEALLNALVTVRAMKENLSFDTVDAPHGA